VQGLFLPDGFDYWGLISKTYFMQGKRQQQIKDSEDYVTYGLYGVIILLLILVIMNVCFLTKN
jgi:hypothetical protein